MYRLITLTLTTAIGLFLLTSPTLAQFERVDAITLEFEEGNLFSALIDPAGDFAYFGTSSFPAHIVKIDLETFEVVDTITLASGEGFGLRPGVIDPEGAFAYFGGLGSPAKVVKIDLTTFEYVATLTLEEGETNLHSAAIDPDGAFAYFGTGTSPGRVVKIDLETFERIDAITLESGENNLEGAIIDPDGAFAYFGALSIPARVVKVDLTTFERVDAIELPEDFLWSAAIDPAGAFAYFGIRGPGTAGGTVAKVDLETFESVDAITLEEGESVLRSAVIDPSGAFAYFGTDGPEPARVVQIDLGAFERVEAITLEEGETGLVSAVIEPDGAFAYFGTFTEPGRVVKVRLAEPVVEPTLAAGWQLLSLPGSGLAVEDIASLNLVQGVEGSYPTASHNLYTGYEGPDYTPATSVEDPLDPGHGFFWYLFEEDDFPGTPPPEWVDVSAFEFPVSFGTIVEEDVDVTFDAIPATEGGDLPPFMIGNPFQAMFDVGGVSVDNGTLQTNFFTWDPGEESYVALTPGDSAGVWEGFWAEVDGAAAPLTFTLDFASTLPLPVPPPPPPPPFEGAVTSFSLPLQLRGTLDSGEHVADLANTLRFEEDAMFGWDRHDGSKFMPPLGTPNYTLLSPEGMRNGTTVRQSVRSLPSGLVEAVTVPVAFRTTGAGTFTVSTIPDNLPEGWCFTLRDLATGAEMDLLEGAYAFTAGATEDWQDRFEVVVTPAGVVGTEDAPVAFRLSSAVPNPASASTSLSLRVTESQRVTARVYDALGRLVTTVHDGTPVAGEEIRLDVDTAAFAAGVYVVRVEGEAFTETRRFAVVR